MACIYYVYREVELYSEVRVACSTDGTEQMEYLSIYLEM